MTEATDGPKTSPIPDIIGGAWTDWEEHRQLCCISEKEFVKHLLNVHRKSCDTYLEATDSKPLAKVNGLCDVHDVKKEDGGKVNTKDAGTQCDSPPPASQHTSHLAITNVESLRNSHNHNDLLSENAGSYKVEVENGESTECSTSDVMVEPDMTSKSLKNEVRLLQRTTKQLNVCQHAYKNGLNKTLDFFQDDFPDLTLAQLAEWMDGFYACLKTVDGNPDRVSPRQMHQKVMGDQKGMGDQKTLEKIKPEPFRTPPSENSTPKKPPSTPSAHNPTYEYDNSPSRPSPDSFKQKVCDFARESSAEAAFELFHRSAPALNLRQIKRWLGQNEHEQEMRMETMESGDDSGMLPVHVENENDMDQLDEEDLSDSGSDLGAMDPNGGDLANTKDRYLSDNDMAIKIDVCMYAAEHSVMEAVEAYRGLLPALTPAIVDRWIKSHHKQCQKFPVPRRNTTMLKPRGSTREYSSHSYDDANIELTGLTPEDAKQHIKRAHTSAMPSYTASFKDSVCRHMEKFGAESTRQQCKRLGLPINFERVNYWLKQFNEISYVERAQMNVGYTTELKIKVCELAMKTSQQKAIKQYKHFAPNLSSSVVSCWMKKYITGGPASLYPFGHKTDPNEEEPSTVPEEPNFSMDLIAEVLDYADNTSIKRAVNRYEAEVPGVTYAVIKKWMIERENGDPYGGEFKEQTFKFNQPTVDYNDRSTHQPMATETTTKRGHDAGLANQNARKRADDDDYKRGQPKSLRMAVGEFAYNNGFMATTNEYPDLDTATIYDFMEEYERYRSNPTANKDNGISEPDSKKPRRSLSTESINTQLQEYPDLYRTVMTSLENLMSSDIQLSPKLAKTMATDTIRTHYPGLLPESGGTLVLDDDWARDVLETITEKQMGGARKSMGGARREAEIEEEMPYSEPASGRSMFSNLTDPVPGVLDLPPRLLSPQHKDTSDEYYKQPQTTIPKAPLIRTMMRGNNSVRYQCDIDDCTHTFGYPHGVKRHQLNSHGRLSGYKTVDASDVIVAKSKRTPRHKDSSDQETGGEESIDEQTPTRSKSSLLQEAPLPFNEEEQVKFPFLATPESSIPTADVANSTPPVTSKFKDSAKFFCEFPGCNKIFPSNTIMRKHMKNTHKYRAMERGGPMLPPSQYDNAVISDSEESDSDDSVPMMSSLPKPRSRGKKSRHDTLISKRGKPIVQCKLCHRTFAYENCLKRHMAFKHPKPGEEKKASIVN